MAYTAPTAAELKARFPEFAGVSDDIVSAALVEAGRMVDETWTEGDFATARMLLAAHYMASEGRGTGSDATVAAKMAGLQALRSGSLSLTAAKASDAAGGSASLYAGTSYGRRFLLLLRQNRGGPRVAAGAFAGVSPYAFDYPCGGW